MLRGIESGRGWVYALRVLGVLAGVGQASIYD